MEKRAIKLSDLLFSTAALVVIVCMFLNWLPVELDLGVIQLDDALGKINALNFGVRLGELEEGLGNWAYYLPEEFEQLKFQAVILTAIAGLTIIAYLSSMALRVMGKDRYAEVMSWLAGIAAIITCTSFRTTMDKIADYIGVGQDILNVVGKNPCSVIMLAGIISLCLTDTVAGVVVNMIDALISAIVNLFMFVAEWVKVILNNLGYFASDIMGAIVGIYLAVLLNNATGTVVLAVPAGLVAAGLVAFICMKIVDRVSMKTKGTAIQ